MTIQELSVRAGVTPRTIRYYVEQGLLPPPGRGRPAEYTEEHVTRLALIRKLKRQYLPLEEIRDTMQTLGTAQVEELLRHGEQIESEIRPLSSAASYIQNVLERNATREDYKHRSAGHTSAAAQPQAQPQAQPPVQAPASAAPAPAAAPPAAQPAAPVSSAPAFRLSKFLHRQRPRQEASSPGADLAARSETWQRVSLGDGIELHYLPRRSETVARILEAVQTIPVEDPEKEAELGNEDPY